MITRVPKATVDWLRKTIPSTTDDQKAGFFHPRYLERWAKATGIRVFERDQWLAAKRGMKTTAPCMIIIGGSTAHVVVERPKEREMLLDCKSLRFFTDIAIEPNTAGVNTDNVRKWMWANQLQATARAQAEMSKKILQLNYTLDHTPIIRAALDILAESGPRAALQHASQNFPIRHARLGFKAGDAAWQEYLYLKSVKTGKIRRPEAVTSVAALMVFLTDYDPDGEIWPRNHITVSARGPMDRSLLGGNTSYKLRGTITADRTEQRNMPVALLAALVTTPTNPSVNYSEEDTKTHFTWKHFTREKKIKYRLNPGGPDLTHSIKLKIPTSVDPVH